MVTFICCGCIRSQILYTKPHINRLSWPLTHYAHVEISFVPGLPRTVLLCNSTDEAMQSSGCGRTRPCSRPLRARDRALFDSFGGALAAADGHSVSWPDVARWHASAMAADAAPAGVEMVRQWQGGWLVRPANPSLQRNDPPGLERP